MKIFRLLSALALVVIGSSSAVFAQYNYTIIQPAGSVFTIPYGMNDSGLMTGFYVQPSGFSVGFVRSANGTITTASLPPGTIQSTLGGVNNAGFAAGSYLDFGGVNHSAVYDTNTDTWIPVPDVPGAAGGIAVSINDANLLAGYSAAGFTNTGSPLGSRGYFYNGSYSFYDAPGVDTSFAGTIPEDINNSNTVVGFFTPTGRGGLFSGFVRDAVGNFTVLDHPGADSTFIQGINDKGVAAGSYESSGVSHSFLWSASKGFTDFDLPFGFNTEIWGIDNKGDLVGTYIDPHGFEAGFLASPAPEPGSIAFCVLASIGIVPRLIRRSKR